MYYDHERKRYFPLQARPPGDTAGERVVGVTAHLAASTPAERKSFSTALLGSTEGIAGRHGICEWDRKRGRGAGAALADVNASKAVARRVRRHIAARETPAES
jgi:hypothetical protein